MGLFQEDLYFQSGHQNQLKSTSPESRFRFCENGMITPLKVQLGVTPERWQILALRVTARAEGYSRLKLWFKV